MNKDTIVKVFHALCEVSDGSVDYCSHLRQRLTEKGEEETFELFNIHKFVKLTAGGNGLVLVAEGDERFRIIGEAPESEDYIAKAKAIFGGFDLLLLGG